MERPDLGTVLGIALITLILLFLALLAGGILVSAKGGTIGQWVTVSSFPVLFVGLVVLFALSRNQPLRHRIRES